MQQVGGKKERWRKRINAKTCEERPMIRSISIFTARGSYSWGRALISHLITDGRRSSGSRRQRSGLDPPSVTGAEAMSRFAMDPNQESSRGQIASTKRTSEPRCPPLTRGRCWWWKCDIRRRPVVYNGCLSGGNPSSTCANLGNVSP